MLEGLADSFIDELWVLGTTLCDSTSLCPISKGLLVTSFGSFGFVGLIMDESKSCCKLRRSLESIPDPCSDTRRCIMSSVNNEPSTCHLEIDSSSLVSLYDMK